MNDRRPERVVVGVDGSESSKQALAYAAGDARRRGAELVVVTAWDAPDWVAAGAFGAPVVLPVDQEAQLRRTTDAAVREVLGDDHGLRIRTIVVHATAGQALTAAARDADLLVVGSRGRREFRSRMLGSTSLSCVLHAACPVVVVHATAPAPRELPQDVLT